MCCSCVHAHEQSADLQVALRAEKRPLTNVRDFGIVLAMLCHDALTDEPTAIVADWPSEDDMHISQRHLLTAALAAMIALMLAPPVPAQTPSESSATRASVLDAGDQGDGVAVRDGKDR